MNFYKKLIFCSVLFICTLPSHAKNVTIAIAQITSHPALDAVREGVKHQLEEQGYREGENLKIIYDNAYGSVATANKIANKLVSIQPDLVVAITTQMAQSMTSASKGKPFPVVFSAVIDPVGAGLVRSFDKHGEFITGTSDMPPIKDQLSLIHHTMKKKPIRLGIIYNSGESDSVFQIKEVQRLASQYNITVVVKVVNKPTKVISAVQSLVPQVDAIYVPLDNIVAASLPSIVRGCMQNDTGKKIPVFASDPEGVRQGALATVGFTRYQEGLLAGRIVSRILAGENPSNIPVTGPEATELYINTSSAKKLGLEVPHSFVKNASEVVRFE